MNPKHFNSSDKRGLLRAPGERDREPQEPFPSPSVGLLPSPQDGQASGSHRYPRSVGALYGNKCKVAGLGDNGVHVSPSPAPCS